MQSNLIDLKAKLEEVSYRLGTQHANMDQKIKHFEINLQEQEKQL